MRFLPNISGKKYIKIEYQGNGKKFDELWAIKHTSKKEGENENFFNKTSKK